MVLSLVLLLSVVNVVLCEPEIQFAAVIFRHGDRTPVRPYTNDPWRNNSYWSVPFGELTNRGKMQHYRLGAWLRKRYSGLLSDRFAPNEIFLLSTDMDRTLMSVMANSAGLYPPTQQDTWNPELHWQPVPVHTVPENEDEVLAMNKLCPRYKAELKNYKKSDEYKKKLRQYSGLMSLVAEYSGDKVDSFDDLEYVYSTLFIERENNFTLPAWTDQIFPERLKEPACYSFKIPTATPALARLKAGPILKEIVGNMNDLVAGATDVRKVYVYSAHDTTVSNVLNALGVFDVHCPAFTATVFIELVKNSGDTFVRVSYRNSSEIVEPLVLEIPSCGTLCPLDKFQNLYSNLVQVNWDYECTQGSVMPLWICLAIVFMLTSMIVIVKVPKPFAFQKNTDKCDYAYEYAS